MRNRRETKRQQQQPKATRQWKLEISYYNFKNPVISNFIFRL